MSSQSVIEKLARLLRSKGANAVMGYGGSPPPTGPTAGGMAAPPPPPIAVPGALPSASTPAKVAFEYGALEAVKTAARVGMTVPTGYRFDLNNEWLGGLGDEAKTRANSEASTINKWLQENTALGGGYAQHPDFARKMVALAQLAKVKPRPKPG